METKTLDQLKDQYYGSIGSDTRDNLERELEALRIGFKIREAREKLGLTQAQLAAKVGKKREFISKIENDGKNITLKTLFEVIKHGLGGKLGVRVEL